MAGLNVSQPQPGQFALVGVLDRNTVACQELHKSALGKLLNLKNDKNSDSMQLDLAEIEHIDTAGLAWLVNVVADCKRKNRSLSIVNSGEALLKLAKISNVESLLPLQ